MIRQFKSVKQLADSTEWDVDLNKHDVIAKNFREMLIKNVFIKKCSYYYELEKLLKDSSIITSSFVMKSIRFDTNDSNTSFENEEKKNEEKKNAKKRAEKTNTNTQEMNIRENDYENWINSNLNDVNIDAKKENKHESSDSFMKDIRSTLLIFKKKKSKIFKTTTTKRRQTKFEAKRAIQMNSNSDEIQFKLIKRDDKSRSMTDAMIKMQHIRFIDFKSQFEVEHVTN